MYPPSMIAAGSVGAAVHGLSNAPHLDVKLLQRLQEITGIEMVSFDSQISYKIHLKRKRKFSAPTFDQNRMRTNQVCAVNSFQTNTLIKVVLFPEAR